MKSILLTLSLMAFAGTAQATIDSDQVRACTSSFNQNGRSPVAGQSSEIEDSWRIVSSYDPKNHDNRNFLYLIAAYHGIDWNSADQVRELISKQPGRGILSMSLIDPAHVNTFMNLPKGFIFDVPVDNLVISSPVDIGPDTADDTRAQLLSQFSLDTPNNLLSETTNIWNEVRVEGATRAGKIKVKALFFLNSISDFEQKSMQALGTELGLPVISLTPSHTYRPLPTPTAP